METHGGNSATRATDLANGAVTSVTRETSSVCTIWLAAVRNMRHQNPAKTIETLNQTMDGITDDRQSIKPYSPAESTTDRNRS